MTTASPAKSKVLVIGNPGGKLSPRAWRKFEQVGLRPELDLDELVFNWTEKRVKDLEAKGAVTGISIEASIESAPTVTVNISDPERKLFRRNRGRTKRRKPGKAQLPLQVDEGWDPILPPDVLGQPMQISLDGVTYQLVKVGYDTGSGAAVLTFEHELVYLLKRHKGAKRAPRGKVTRAQFILSLVRELEPEIRKRVYRFACPELNVRQPIEAGQKRKTQTAVSGTSSGGGGGRNLDRRFPGHALGAKAVRLTEDEVRACAAAGGFWGRELDAMVALANGESQRYPGVINSIGATGIWQMYSAGWGPAGVAEMNRLGGQAAMRNPIQNAKMARYLYEGAGKTYSGQWEFQIPFAGGPGNGRPSRAQARELAATVTSGSAAEVTANGKSVTRSKSYQFSRGKTEHSWAAMQRLAAEVAWRAFVVGNSLYYMSEEELYGRRPRYRVSPPGWDDPATRRLDDLGASVLGLTYDVDWGRPVSEANLTVTLARWQAPPGSVVLLDGFGPPDGRWLVTGVSRDYFAPTAEVKLIQPGKAKLEPAAEQKQRSARPPGSSSSGGGSDDHGAASRFYERAVEISKKNYEYAWGGGHNSTGKPSYDIRGEGNFGYDCSGYIGACCLAAGWGQAAHSSDFGGFAKAKPGRGKFVSVYYSSNHVYAVFEDALGVSHDRADTSPHGSGGYGPHVRTGGAYAGYSVCHYGGD